VPLLLNNIHADLNPGGTMIHSIHLEDHRDIKNDPFGFLAIPSNDYPASLQSARGNRSERVAGKKYSVPLKTQIANSSMCGHAKIRNYLFT
jgi:hypothetical protein